MDSTSAKTRRRGRSAFGCAPGFWLLVFGYWLMAMPSTTASACFAAPRNARLSANSRRRLDIRIAKETLRREALVSGVEPFPTDSTDASASFRYFAKPRNARLSASLGGNVSRGGDTSPERLREGVAAECAANADFSYRVRHKKPITKNQQPKTGAKRPPLFSSRIQNRIGAMAYNTLVSWQRRDTLRDRAGTRSPR